MDIRQVRLDLKWIGVGFLDLAVFLQGVWKAGARSNINSRWKHPIQLWKPMINPSGCCLHVLTKAKGKGTWALPEILPRLWTTIWQRGTVWKTPSQQTLRKYQPCASTRELLHNTKNVSINKTLSITNFAHDFYHTT